MKKYIIAILMVLMITGSAGAWQWFPIASSIVDGVTNQCPDGNSVFDALVGKQGVGTLKLTTGAEPTCNEAARGTFWYIAGAAGVKDVVEACTKDAANSYGWRIIY